MWPWRSTLEAVWMGMEGTVKRGLTCGMHGRRGAVVNAVWRHVADAGMAMHSVVPGEEFLAEGTCVGQAPEPRRELRAVLHRFELSL